MTRFHLLSFVLISFLLNACTGNQQNTRTEKAQNGFVFSNQVPATGDDNSLCRKLLPDAVVINADPANTNRRLFLMSGGGVYKVTADFGNIVASFALQNPEKTSLFLPAITTPNVSPTANISPSANPEIS